MRVTITGRCRLQPWLKILAARAYTRSVGHEDQLRMPAYGPLTTVKYLTRRRTRSHGRSSGCDAVCQSAGLLPDLNLCIGGSSSVDGVSRASGAHIPRFVCGLLISPTSSVSYVDRSVTIFTTSSMLDGTVVTFAGPFLIVLSQSVPNGLKARAGAHAPVRRNRFVAMP